MFKGRGRLVFDYRNGSKVFEPWWAMVLCDREIQRYYAWHLLKRGRKADMASPWGTHISVIKGEEPKYKEKWLKYQRVWVEFEYTGNIRYDNDKQSHAWIDVYSQQLSDIRVDLGLFAKTRYHLTIGRLL